MSIVKSIIDLFSEIWKWARIVSRQSFIGELEKLAQRKCLTPGKSLRKEIANHGCGEEVTVSSSGCEVPLSAKKESSETSVHDIPPNPIGNEMQIAEKIVKDVIDDIEFVKKSGTQKNSWLIFSNIPDSSSIRYYVVKNVHETSGIIPKWLKINEITFTLP